MSSPDPEAILYDQLAALCRTLGNPHRLGLLDILAQGERSVESLAAETGQSLANISQHLQQCRRQGLVDSRRDGKYQLYRLSAAPLLPALQTLRALSDYSAGLRRDAAHSYFTGLDDLAAVSREDLSRMLERGEVMLLDVRSVEEFRQGHIPGALNVPLHRLQAALADLPPEQEVVAYCRGPYCILSYQAVALLRTGGLRARRLEDGYPEWRMEGRPTAAAAQPPAPQAP